ncbi:unnamed protein product [Linum tenue]|uniref:Transducin family protein / WD-40 repeat family protein n=1 Tax=Linum tenue TaxID=586396 RepID=A0AAV0KYZ5_9ROSI|nr:unnamed protein product [Linum tenue]
MSLNRSTKDMSARLPPPDQNSLQSAQSSNSAQSSRKNALRLLVQREICPRGKHVPKKGWGEASHVNVNSPSEAKSEPARDPKRGLISWVEAESLRHLSAKYCPLMPPPRSTIAAAFSPDGKTLASTHGDHTVKIIDCQTGKCLKVLSGHRRTPWVVRFHPLHPEILASGSLDYEVRLWDANTAECVGSRDFNRPIASIAFHAEGQLLAVASGHKLYIWHYNKRGEASSPTVVLRTKRSLRAVHFHPHAAPFLLTAEVNDLDSSDSTMSRATSPGYLRYPPPAVFVANVQSSERVNVAAELPLMSLPLLVMPSIPVDDTRVNDNRDVSSSSSSMQVESSMRMQIQTETTAPMETHSDIVAGSCPAISSASSNYFHTGARTPGITEDAMDTDEPPHMRPNHQEINAFSEGNSTADGGPRHGSIRQQSTEFGQVHQLLPPRDPVWWEVPFLQGCEMGAHFSPCGRYLAACVACTLPQMEADPGLQALVHHDAGVATSPTRHPISAHQVMYELRIYSLEEATFGSVLVSRAIRAAHCLTSIQFSPTSEHILLAYGRRHGSLLKSVVIDGETTSLIYTVLEVYRVSDMELVRVLPSAEDEVNVACFHPSAGGGLVYGTKEGRLRVLQYDSAHGSNCSTLNYVAENLAEVD